MKTKNLSKKILALLICTVISFAGVFGFAGCNNGNNSGNGTSSIGNGDGNEEVFEYVLYYTREHQTIKVSEFSLNLIHIMKRVNNKDALVSYATEDMISTDDLDKLKTPGSHDIEVMFGNQILTVTIDLEADNEEVDDDSDVDPYIVYSKEGTTIELAEFSYNLLNIKRKLNGITYTYSVNEEMLSEADRNKLKTTGTHTIKVNWNGNSFTVVIALKENTLKDIAPVLHYVNAGKAIDVDDFSYGDLFITGRKDGVDYNVPVTADMISEADREKLSVAGTHNITVRYNGASLRVTIILKSSAQGGTITGNLVFNSTVSPASYYSGIDSLSGTALKNKLREIISKVTKRTTYDNLKVDLCKTDLAIGSTNQILLIYSRKKVAARWDGAVSWNREHVWPQSKGWFSESGAGSDLQHIRPEDPGVNSSRGNKPFAETSSGGYYVPDKAVRGDVARIIFYLLVRYSEADGYRVTSVAKSMNMLLQWNHDDPVDEWEIQRNKKSQEIQGNRNPFIDCEELADRIWGLAA